MLACYGVSTCLQLGYKKKIRIHCPVFFSPASAQVSGVVAVPQVSGLVAVLRVSGVVAVPQVSGVVAVLRVSGVVAVA